MVPKNHHFCPRYLSLHEEYFYSHQCKKLEYIENHQIKLSQKERFLTSFSNDLLQLDSPKKRQNSIKINLLRNRYV